MGYLALLIALGVVLLYAYGSRKQRLKTQGKQKTKASKATKVYPLSRVKKQSNLRRIK